MPDLTPKGRVARRIAALDPVAANRVAQRIAAVERRSSSVARLQLEEPGEISSRQIAGNCNAAAKKVQMKDAKDEIAKHEQDENTDADVNWRKADSRDIVAQQMRLASEHVGENNRKIESLMLAKAMGEHLDDTTGDPDSPLQTLKDRHAHAMEIIRSVSKERAALRPKLQPQSSWNCEGGPRVVAKADQRGIDRPSSAPVIFLDPHANAPPLKQNHVELIDEVEEREARKAKPSTPMLSMGYLRELAQEDRQSSKKGSAATEDQLRITFSPRWGRRDDAERHMYSGNSISASFHDSYGWGQLTPRLVRCAYSAIPCCRLEIHKDPQIVQCGFAIQIPRCKKIEDAVREIVADEGCKSVARGACKGGVAGGVAGAGAGVLVGGSLGALCGLPLAPFTLGLSVVVGANVGGGAGLCTGAVGGSSAGAVSGGVVSFLAHRIRRGSRAKIESRPIKAISVVSDADQSNI